MSADTRTRERAGRVRPSSSGRPARSPRRPARRRGPGRASPRSSTSAASTSTSSTPTRAPTPEDEARGEEFLAELREVARPGSTAPASSASPGSPTRTSPALAEIGAFGMKIPREYGGLGLTMSAYGRALMLVGSVSPSLGALLSAHQSIGVPEPVKLVGTEEQKQRFLPRCAAGAISRLPAHRARRRAPTRPGCGSTATPTEDGTAYVLDGREAVDDQRRRRRAARRHGPGPGARRRPPGRHHRVRRRGRLPGHHRRAAQRLHGPARHRERRHPLPPGAGARRRTGSATRATASRSP